MFLIIVAFALIAGSAAFHWRQGLFSSGIMALLSLLCAAVALGWYEPLARATLYDSHMEYADALCLVGLFVLPLLVLRIIMDRLISRSVVLNSWVDGVGGAVMGALTGMLAFGVLFIALQMLPWGPTVVGYTPYDASIDQQGSVESGYDDRQDRLAPFYCDEFVLGLTKGLSGGALKSDDDWNFDRAHKDLLRELYCARYRIERSGRIETGNVVEEVTNRYGRIDARRGDLEVAAVIECPEEFIANWQPADQRHPLLAEAAKRKEKLYVVRVKVSRYAREMESSPALDWWILPLPHFRLVTEKGNNYYPLGYLTYRSSDDLENSVKEARRHNWPKPQDWLFIGPEPLNKEQPRPERYSRGELSVDRRFDGKGDWLVIDWVFAMKPDKDDPPAYMAFRRAAVAPAPKIVTGKAAQTMIETPQFTAAALTRSSK
ncbi:MAG: CvpA family protein [Planctomycetaceae bacterium]|nr:CvpA family protein [Planctomycetaceae bacterium]